MVCQPNYASCREGLARSGAPFIEHHGADAEPVYIEAADADLINDLIQQAILQHLTDEQLHQCDEHQHTECASAIDVACHAPHV